MSHFRENKPPATPQPTLRQRTARGLMWGFLNNGTMQLLSALFGILLLRKLHPEDYGKIAMLMVFAQIASTLQESGFTQALCNLKQPRHVDYNAVFWFNILISGLMYLVLFFCAPLIVRFYNDPDLLWLSRYLFLGFFISSWGTVQRAWMFINMKNRETAIIALISMIVSGCVGVAMVYSGLAYWGLATQTVLFILVVALLNWHYSPWRPSLPVNNERKALRTMFGFGSKLLLTNLFNNLSAHAFGVLLGRFYGGHQTGVYANARKWNDMAANTVNGMVAGVAQPVLTQVRDNRGRYCQVFRKMLRFVSFVSFPAMLGLALVAREFLLLVGGEKWVESASLLSMLCIYGAFFPIQTLYAQMTISMGRSTVNFVSTVALCLLVWAGLIALHPLGIYWMVVYFIIVNLLWLGVWQWWANRLVGLRLWDALRDVAPFFVFSALVMMLTWWITQPLASHLWALLFCRVAVAALLYIGLLWVSGAKILRESIDYLLHRGK